MEHDNRLEPSIFVVKTVAGQEKNAAELVYVKVKIDKLPVLSILVPESLRGYIFIETAGSHIVDQAISGVKNVKSKVSGKVQYSEIEKYLIVKPIIDEIEVGYEVEITGGPVKGMKAKITKVNKVRSEATLELLEATFTLPITVHADYLKVVEKN
ncbi:transcription elongation factor Spt5 [Candidatus Bathyarchaeota archaeon]|nr:MAG: transcription elongation factor Spt5 [Candidatus Bathyarchaeota archaeon]